MADFYRNLVPFEIGVMPGPGLPARARAAKAAGGPPVVSCIGFANRAKGYRLLPQAMQHVLDRHGDVRFMIHGIVKGSDAEADQPLFDRLAELGERVEVRQEVLAVRRVSGPVGRGRPVAAALRSRCLPPGAVRGCSRMPIMSAYPSSPRRTAPLPGRPSREVGAWR